MIKITKVVTSEADTEVTVSYSLGEKTVSFSVLESELKLKAQKAAEALKRDVTEQDLLDAVKVIVEEKRASTVAEPADLDLGVYIGSDLEKQVPAATARKRTVVPVAYELVPEPPPEPEPPLEEEYPVDPETGLPITPTNPNLNLKFQMKRRSHNGYYPSF